MAGAAPKVRVLCPTPGCARAYSVTVADLDKSLFCKHCKKKFKLNRLDHYVVLEELGRGSFGVVNRVFDLQEKREAAVKVLNTDAIPPDLIEEWIERARIEAQVLANIVHPNILPLYRSGTCQGRFFMVTPLLPGKTLDRLIPPQGFADPVEAVETTVTILRALYHVHGTKICHRDIKPGNIMVGSGGIIYVMDFGLAVCHESDASRLTEYGTTLGTPAYMPPEQAAGETDRIGPWSDQYSCGVVLYKMLTGNVPYPGKGIAVIPDIKDLKKPPLPPRHFRPDLDPELERLILKSLEKFPGKRYGSCQEFAEHLKEWAEQMKSERRMPAIAALRGAQTGGAEELPEAIEPSDDGRTSGARGWLWALVLLLLVGAGVGGWFVWRESQNQSKDPPSDNKKKIEFDDWSKKKTGP